MLRARRQPFPHHREKDQDRAFNALLTRARTTKGDYKRVFRLINAAVAQGKALRQEQQERGQEIKTLQRTEKKTYPSQDTAPSLSQGERTKQELGSRFPQQYEPDFRLQSNHSQPYRTKGFANPLLPSTHTRISRRKTSSPSKPQLSLNPPHLEAVGYEPPDFLLKTTTEATKPVKPTKYGPGHPAFPKHKSSKVFVKFRQELKDRQKLEIPVSTISGKHRLAPAGDHVVLNELPQKTKDAIQSNIGLQNQITSKTGSAPAYKHV
ncbi:hypothetical protein FKW77_001270 [Venturia effusa]|uniref:Uncharacterized protein n=1 Tax=Venturia effusa TaxID=50376 RepID=A0A517LM83_9PEZI|nr:hypothetical protein FKW77_001270 [Venturia effusa]